MKSGSTGAVVGGMVIGMMIGVILGWINRPSYLGGLVKPELSDLNNNRMFSDVLGTVVSYGLVGLVLGGILFYIVAKVSSK